MKRCPLIGAKLHKCHRMESGLIDILWQGRFARKRVCLTDCARELQQIKLHFTIYLRAFTKLEKEKLVRNVGGYLNRTPVPSTHHRGVVEAFDHLPIPAAIKVIWEREPSERVLCQLQAFQVADALSSCFRCPKHFL
ncbi:hypothetical protein CDAR_423181 [Caerostris darwini]|uniref:Uncharacterized protein n=1 Tax=Caerostris darwini TaxID=1538125 RepID=A0AAV4UQF5_9ARAC|nr:hypothetical protein CDAR_423181 [Caerostris darwini]